MNTAISLPDIRAEAARLAKQLIELEHTSGKLDEIHSNVKDVLTLLRRLELLPMKEILARIPGVRIEDKARKIGVTRQTFHYWSVGRYRPSAAQGLRISKITGIPVTQITMAE